jgi:hypothetical protein
MPLVLTRSELTYLAATRMKQTRPARFREMLRVDRSVPIWAGDVEVAQIETYADFKVIQTMTQDLPKSSLDRTSSKQSIHVFAAGYDVFDIEIERARKLGISLDNMKSKANAMRAEQILNSIAAGQYATPAINGITDAGTTPIAAGGTWDSTTNPTTILDALHGVVNAVAVNSKEVASADTLLLPQSTYHLITTKRLGDGTDRTVLTALRAQSPYLRRIMSWYPLETASAGGGKRVIAYDSASPLGPRMVISQELTDHEPARQPLGYTIAQTFATAGVVIEMGETVAYLDDV